MNRGGAIGSSIPRPQTGVLYYGVPRSVTAAATAAPTDVLILGDATSAAFSITLPRVRAVAPNKFFIIKKTDASANAVTVDGDGSEQIDHAATYALAGQDDFVWIVADHTNNRWHVISFG